MTSEYPEKGELVLGTVKNIFNQGAFIDLEEYPGRTGMLHITEISLKWVRNIRDYVKEGQKVVLIALRIDESKGHVDLSLRRVADSQRKMKLQQIKQMQRSKKLVDMVAENSGLDRQKLQSQIEKAFPEYDSLYGVFESISADNSVADKIKIDKAAKEALIELINKSIKPPEVLVVGHVELRCNRPDGINIIKKALKEIKNHKNAKTKMEISYVAPPFYRVKVSADDYKSAEKCLKNSVNAGIKYVASKSGIGEFHRELVSK